MRDAGTASQPPAETIGNAKNKAKFPSLAVAAVLVAILVYLWWAHEAIRPRDALLSLMPKDAEGIVFVDFSHLRQAPFFADLLSWAPKPDTDAEYRQFVQETGFDYERDLQFLAIAFEKQDAQQTFFAVADGRFDQRKIKAYAIKIGASQMSGSTEILSLPLAGSSSRVSFAFLHKNRLAVTNGRDLSALLTAKSNSNFGEWRIRFNRLAGSSLFAVIRNEGIKAALATKPPSQDFARRATAGFTSPQLSALVQQLQWVTVAGKPENDGFRIVAEGESSEDSNARQLADLLNGVVLLARAGLTSVRPEQINATTRESYLALLKSVDVSRIDRGETNSVRVMFDVTPAFLKSAQMPAPAVAPALPPANPHVHPQH